MYPVNFLRLAIIAIGVMTSAVTSANDFIETDFVEEITIVGERQGGEQVPGSAQYVHLSQIERLGHSDIQRIIRQIPGVSVQIEDGYGLRPNISIRGVATERSGRNLVWLRFSEQFRLESFPHI